MTGLICAVRCTQLPESVPATRVRARWRRRRALRGRHSRALRSLPIPRHFALRVRLGACAPSPFARSTAVRAIMVRSSMHSRSIHRALPRCAMTMTTAIEIAMMRPCMRPPTSRRNSIPLERLHVPPRTCSASAPSPMATSAMTPRPTPVPSRLARRPRAVAGRSPPAPAASSRGPHALSATMPTRTGIARVAHALREQQHE